MEAVVGLVDLVAEHEAVLRQLVGDREHGRAHALVVGRQEADDRDQQRRRVERVGVVVLAEHAALGDAVLEDVGADLVGDRLPLLRQLALALELRSRAPRSSATQHISFEET